MWDCAWKGGGNTYWNSCIALLDSPSHTWEHSAKSSFITVSGRRGNWGRTVPLCGFTVGHSFSDMQGINQEPGLLGFSVCKNRMKFTWSYSGNRVPVDVQLIRPQLFAKSKMQSLTSSHHIKTKWAYAFLQTEIKLCPPDVPKTCPAF